MLYELMGIARISDPLKTNKEAVKIVSTIGRLILQNRGVIRSVTNMGPRNLPKLIKKDQESHFQGYHFMMHFDSSSRVQQELMRTLQKDPRVLRASVVKNDINKLPLNTGTSFERSCEAVAK